MKDASYFMMCGFCLGLFFIFIGTVIWMETRHAQLRSQLSREKQHARVSNRVTSSTPHITAFQITCIGLPKRKHRYFGRVQTMLREEGLDVAYFEAINGKEVDRSRYNLHPRYREFFENNEKERNEQKTTVDYRGHFGAALSHLAVLRTVSPTTPMLILEDDVEIVPGQFKSRVLQVMNQLPSDWDVFLLGWCCKYEDYDKCKLNDCEAVQVGGFVRVHYWIGGWGYMVRNQVSAQKILDDFSPQMKWHIDIRCAELCQEGKINVYGAIPTLVNHPGYLRISSFDYNQYGDHTFIRTDTNS